YFRGEEFHHEVWLLMGIVNRLAMRAGLHRDGSRYPELSCFAAEMRRRIWTLMSQLDALISFQLGLPRMIYDGLADTQPPRNLLDEDFSEDSTSLPPPRPDTAFTPVAYLIAKSRLSRVFGLVIDHAASTTPIPSALIYQLDKQLNESYAAVPVCLQFRSVSESVTASPRIVMLRYNLEILYQKTRCILHRKSLCEGRSDGRYAESRRICLDAAVRILQHQATIDVQVQAGGVLGQCRWFVTSLATNDFMLAAMVVCLELHYLEREGAQGGQTGTPGRDELLLALQTSHLIWAQYKDESAEAWQAWQSTSIMLRKLNASVSPSDGSNGGENTSSHSTTSTETEIEKSDPMLGVSLDHQLDGSMSVTEPKMLSPSEPEFDLSHLPSELVNLWDFTGDMSWLAMSTAGYDDRYTSPAESDFGVGEAQASERLRPFKYSRSHTVSFSNLVTSKDYRNQQREEDIRALISEMAGYNSRECLLPREQEMELTRHLVRDVVDIGTHTIKPKQFKTASIIELRSINQRNVCEDTLNFQTGCFDSASSSSSSTRAPAAEEDNWEIPISCFQDFATPIIPNGVADGPAAESNIANSALARSVYSYEGYGWRQKQYVLVEWRLRSLSAQNSVDEEAQAKRYRYFAQLLRRTSMINEVCILHCLGYSLATGRLSDGTQHPVVGFVYEFPGWLKSTASVLTLEEKIAGRTGTFAPVTPFLENRFRLAQRLSLALLHLHCAGWKHRQLSSDNIIFFRGPHHPWHPISIPYIGGWQCTPDDYRMQDDNPGSDEMLTRFWRGDDLKNFAVILMEIALWKSPCEAYRNAAKLNRPGLSKNNRCIISSESAQSLYSTLRVQLGGSMGCYYEYAVEECLRGSRLASSNTSTEKHFLDEVVLSLHKCPFD
ncbi:hypothetical protein ABHI18_000064, partial [Aspergillus niger]